MSTTGNVKLGRALHAKLKRMADAENRSIVGQIRELLDYYERNHVEVN